MSGNASEIERIAACLRQFPDALGTSKVIGVSVEHYRGTVYDLQTATSLYLVGDGIVSSNCRCSFTFTLTEEYEALLASDGPPHPETFEPGPLGPEPKTYAPVEHKEPPERQPKLEAAPRPPGHYEPPPNVPLPPPPPPQAPTKPKKPPRPRAPRKPKPPPDPFPADPATAEFVKALGGSTGAELVRDPATGKLFVRKRGNSADHLREEALADAAYQALGARVPAFRLYDTPAGPVKLAEFVEGRTLAEVMKADPKLAAKGLKDLQKHFAADALLGNWDVVGLKQDNVLVDKKGNAWRIDNGGALRFRAQGVRKTADQWDDYPTELWTLRDSKTNPQSAQAFAGLKFTDIVGQVEALDAKGLALPPDLAKTVQSRLTQLKDVAARANTLTADLFLPEYADGFTKHMIGIRKAGIADAMPRKLTQTAKGSVIVEDEHGKPWDHLRGADSLVGKLERYLEQGPGNGTYMTIRHWMGQQSGSSWSDQAKAYKAYLAAQRSAPLASYWWQGTPKQCASDLALYEKRAGGKERYANAMQALHAFTHEYLSRADFPNKNADGTVTLLRTENVHVMKKHGLKPGEQDVRLQRGVAESTSIFRPVTVYGSELTSQRVPLHRVVATYWQERYAGFQGGAFAGDHENEFIAILDDLPLNYVK